MELRTSPPLLYVTMEWCFSTQPRLLFPTTNYEQHAIGHMQISGQRWGVAKSNRDAAYSECYRCFSQSLKVKTDQTSHQATTASFHISSNSLLGAFVYSPKMRISIVCLPSCISSSPTGRTSVSNETGAFYENLLRISKFC